MEAYDILIMQIVFLVKCNKLLDLYQQCMSTVHFMTTENCATLECLSCYS